MKNKNPFLLLFFLIYGYSSYCQGTGTWKSHLPYKNGKKVCEVGNRIFCVSENGLFYYDKEENSTNILTKEDGLSDIEITAIGYNEKEEIVVIGYNTGYIDILDKNLKVTPLSDIFRSTSIIGSKAITKITFLNEKAYLSTDFGVVIVDVKQKEIKESYRNIGPKGEEVSIKNIFFNNTKDSIYVHNQFGLCKSSLKGRNLLNFKNWFYYKDSLGDLQNSFDFYVLLENKLIAAKNKDAIYEFDTDKQDFIKKGYYVVPWTDFASFEKNYSSIVVSYSFGIIGVINPAGELKYTDIKYSSQSEVILDKEGHLWAAGENSGLHSNYKEGTWREFSPSGTVTRASFGLYSYSDKLISLSGGYNGSFVPNYNQKGFSLYSGGTWSNYNKTLSNGKYFFLDPLDALYDPVRRKYFLAHYFSGLVVWDGLDTYTRLTKADSSSIPFFTIGDQTRITSVTMDKKNNIWVTNNLTGSEPSIHKLLPDNTWESFSLKGAFGSEPIDLVIDDADQKWILCKGQNLIVWDEITKEEKSLSSITGQGKLPSTKINTIEKDREGQIWVGTDKGVAVFTDPQLALRSDFYEANLPIFERRPLLQDEQVLTICIDAANRKWFGTSNGVFLFNENATENLLNFNTSNSLLPSNKIKDIAINELTGEVFFATEKGIVSYRGDATEPKPDFANAKIFPNPIQPGFEGVVTISGLKENTTVKITDIAGKLIYEQTSNGGTATWTTKNLDGKLAESGVYLVYSTDSEFEDSFVGKIVIVH